ncbi:MULTISPECIES: class I SAM-dependent methyltransferase [Nostocales]|uniref:Class I SAM-dependent methyltransferase n=3 Tax=Nostocales TaxID=1161 RepID=A0A0C1QWV0_9CYAN|nr:class I SAM-dependent methyltransferase [Tolypothrix bouteillei]KAF3885847.1 class I SAM-dependent methyltransferase [Tolypothrix bouteillei VB521301]
MNQQREFPDWDKLYREGQVESMPWFNPDLDSDLDEALTKLNISTGMALDLGTGPGTQAIILAERGYKVTATDISATAINQAQIVAKKEGLDITFREDDILHSNLSQEFDFVFDRGCFHVLPPDLRQDYVRAVRSLIKHKGFLFLKCFSHLEKREPGPYRFTPEEIREIFTHGFKIVSVQETVYQGTLDPLPKALFCILERQ